MSSEEKKDLTSLVDVAKRDPESIAGGEPALEMPAQEALSEDDFKSLEEYSKEAVFDSPQAVEAPLAEAPPASEEPLPAEQPDFPAPDGGGFDSGIEGLSDLPSFEAPVVPEPESLPEPEPIADPVSVPEPFEAAELPQEPVVSPPPKAAKTVLSKEAPTQKQDLGDVKKFGDKFAIGHPRIEASPPFSVMAAFRYDEKKADQIRDILESEDFGVKFGEISVQLKSGKLFIPKVSEFAAITLAQKLREVCDDIEMGLSSEIYKTKDPDVANTDFENVLFDQETFHVHEEDVRDLAAEPKSEREMFTTHLEGIEGHRVTRVLSALTVSKVVEADVAEDGTGVLLEKETDALTRELMTRAFKLGAHGVVGISFTLKSFEAQTSLGKRRGYRLWGSGTAVRVRAVKAPIE